MKMGPGLFWGILFLLVGFVLIIKVVLKIDVPVFRIVAGLILIILGVRMLIGGDWFFQRDLDENDIVFQEKYFKGKEISRDEYNVLFSKSSFDFTDIDSTDLPKQIKINTVFGSTTVYLKTDIPVKIKGDAVFAGARLPGGNTAVFGSAYYESEGFNPSEPFLYIKTDVVFGGVEVYYKD